MISQFDYCYSLNLCIDRTGNARSMTAADVRKIKEACDSGDFTFLFDEGQFAFPDDCTFALMDDSVSFDAPVLRAEAHGIEVFLMVHFRVESDMDEDDVDVAVQECIRVEFKGYETAEYS